MVFPDPEARFFRCFVGTSFRDRNWWWKCGTSLDTSPGKSTSLFGNRWTQVFDGPCQQSVDMFFVVEREDLCHRFHPVGWFHSVGQPATIRRGSTAHGDVPIPKRWMRDSIGTDQSPLCTDNSRNGFRRRTSLCLNNHWRVRWHFCRLRFVLPSPHYFAPHRHQFFLPHYTEQKRRTL